MGTNLGVTHAFILAGGIGSRLRPLTNSIPKVLIPVAGKPIIVHNIELLRKFGVTNIVIGTGYLGEQIDEYFAEHPMRGTTIVCSQEKVFLGTAGALRLAEDHIQGKTFFMMNGDELKDIDMRKVHAVHVKNKVLATLALTRVEDPSKFGVVAQDGDLITKFVEKPKENAPSNLINAGFYILERDVLSMIPKGKNVSIEKEVFPVIAQRGMLAGCEFFGEWLPTDDFERLEFARKNWHGISF